MKFLAYTAIVATVTMVALQAHAQAKFASATVSCNANETITVEYQIIGAGTGTSASVVLTGDAEAGCRTPGTEPPGQDQDVNASGTASANRQGRIVGSLTSQPLERCPGRQERFADYSGLVLTATLDNGDVISTSVASISCSD